MAWERPVVESWKESWTKSTGRVEVFSRVIRMVDLWEERREEREGQRGKKTRRTNEGTRVEKEERNRDEG